MSGLGSPGRRGGPGSQGQASTCGGVPLSTGLQTSAGGRENSPALESKFTRRTFQGLRPSHPTPDRPPPAHFSGFFGVQGAEARLRPPLHPDPRPVRPRDCPWLLLASTGNDFSVLRPLRSAPLSPSRARLWATRGPLGDRPPSAPPPPAPPARPTLYLHASLTRAALEALSAVHAGGAPFALQGEAKACRGLELLVTEPPPSPRHYGGRRSETVFGGGT